MATGLGPDDPVEVGEGRYELTARLGQGGMGTVYLGRSLSGRAVAVKVIRRELAADAGFRQRFMREVEAARRVSGFHTAAVVDADASSDRPWLVTAYIAAPSLDEVIAGHGPLRESALYALGAGLAEALAAIHVADVVHRDLKPGNILVAEDGPRVIDFGIARAMDQTQVTLTGYRVGTPGFLSPEQLTGDVLTPAVDVFALGVVLCRAAGTAPFGEGPVESLLYRVVHEEPDLQGLSSELRDVVALCLAKDPSARPSPGQVLRRLASRPRQQDGRWLTDRLRTMIEEHRTETTALMRAAAQRTEPPGAVRDRAGRVPNRPAAPPPTAPGSAPSSTGASSRPPSPPSAPRATRRPTRASSAEPRQARTSDGVGQRADPPSISVVMRAIGVLATAFGVLLLTAFVVALATGAATPQFIPLAVGLIIVGLVFYRRGSRKARVRQGPGPR